MKDKDPALVSYRPIDRGDLVRLLALARADREEFFVHHRDWAELYKDRVLGVALCQGAALHYIDPGVGLNDFDVYTFYAAHPRRRWYAKRIKSVDFGDPKFGQSEVTKPGFKGRRVDLMGRELPVPPKADLTTALIPWLQTGRTATAHELRRKAVVLLEPEHRLGTVVWPPGRNTLAV
jgi:hypothetical protein